MMASRANLSLEISYKTISDRLAGASFSELEDFIADVRCRFVLSIPNVNMRKIVTDRLDQWKLATRPGKSESQ